MVSGSRIYVLHATNQSAWRAPDGEVPRTPGACEVDSNVDLKSHSGQSCRSAPRDMERRVRGIEHRHASQQQPGSIRRQRAAREIAPATKVISSGATCIHDAVQDLGAGCAQRDYRLSHRS
jgi:hypothetical protein